MLTPATIKIAIVLMHRAPLKGEEARNVVAALDELNSLFDILTTPPESEEEDDDS